MKCLVKCGALSYLRGSKVKFLQADYVSIPELIHLVAFGVEQDFKGQDELQVGGRSHIIMSTQLGVVALGQLSHTLLERLTHFHHPTNKAKLTMSVFVSHIQPTVKGNKCRHMSALHPDVVFQVQILKELVGDHLQSVFRPGLKPVYGAAVDQRWKHPQTIAEAFTYWAHCYWTNMNTALNLYKIHLILLK